jgi:hypothetical protein
MKKKVVLTATLLASLFVLNTAFAQEPKGFTNVKGMNILNAGVGLGSYGLAGTGGIPLTASFERGFSKNISAGATVGLVQRKFASNWKYTYLLFGARGSYHLNEAFKISNPKLGVYAGAGLLYRRFSVKYTAKDSGDEPGLDINSSGGDIDFQLHAGGRYLFNNKLGAFAELGYRISPLQIGLTVKL